MISQRERTVTDSLEGGRYTDRKRDRERETQSDVVSALIISHTVALGERQPPG